MHESTGPDRWAWSESFDASFAITPSCEKRYLLHNRTPRRLCIEGGAERGELVLPPLAERVVTGARLAPFEPQLRLLRQRHHLRIREYEPPSHRHAGFSIAIGFAVLTTTVLSGIALLTAGTLKRVEVGASAAVTVLLVVAAVWWASRKEGDRKGQATIADREEGDIEFGVGGAFYDGNETLRRTSHLLTLAGVVIIGAVLPAIAIFVATDAKEFLTLEGGLQVVDGRESRLVARLIQMTYTAVLALFPAILYFQFDRHRVGTIRGEWVRAIFRVDRRMETLADVNARYGDQLSEASNYSVDSVRLLGGRNSPIVIATLLLSLGWTLLVVPTHSADFAGTARVAALADAAADAAERAGDAAVEADGEADAVTTAARAEAEAATNEAERVADESIGGSTPSTTDTTAPGETTPSADDEAATAAAAAERAAIAEDRIDQPFFQLLVPEPSTATMAFLGAYFFGVYLLLRSYFRGDLRPKIYNQITARLVTVVVIAYLINTLFFADGIRNRFVWALAFLAGVVPTTVLQRLGRLLSGVPAGLQDHVRWLDDRFVDTFSTPRSLTVVDGIDIHDSTRLETEGINDIPSLAGGDLVSAMIKTRLPIERLVDWTDQAVLILLLDDVTTEKLDSRVEQLRHAGIRTASAVVDAHDGAFGDDGRATVADIVSAPFAAGATGESRCSLEALAKQIAAEPVMQQITAWRDSDLGRLDTCPTTVVHEDGTMVCASAGSRRGGRRVVASASRNGGS